MPERPIAVQVCEVCNPPRRFRNKRDLQEHADEAHGTKWPVGWMTRAKDQMEFKPSLGQTPWGREFKEGPRR